MAEKQKSKKIGRTRKGAQNLRYIAERRHEKSHVRRIAAHLRRYGYVEGKGYVDREAVAALNRLAPLAGMVKQVREML